MCSEWNQHLFSGHLWSGFRGAYPLSPCGTPVRAKIEHHSERHERLHQADGGSGERMGYTTDERGRASLSLVLRHHSSLRDMIRYCRVLPHMSSRFGRSLYERKSRHSRKERAAPRWRDPRFSRDESEELYTIVPEVRTADACQHDANDSVSRLFDGRVWSLARLNSALSLE